MKLSRTKLKEIILEVIQENEDAQDPTKIKTGSMSTGARVKGSRERIMGDADEFTNQERNIIDQLESFISNLASEPGIDLMQFRPLLQRVLKLLQQQAARTVKQTPQGEPE
jgi:hypothetical protein